MRISDWSSDVCSSDLTWSHMNLNENALAAWQADLLRDEAVIAPLMTDGDWHWLRYHYPAEGETPERWQAARRFLAGHGYRIASVTMSFAYYAWAARSEERRVGKTDVATIRFRGLLSCLKKTVHMV